MVLEQQLSLDGSFGSPEVRWVNLESKKKAGRDTTSFRSGQAGDHMYSWLGLDTPTTTRSTTSPSSTTTVVPASCNEVMLQIPVVSITSPYAMTDAQVAEEKTELDVIFNRLRRCITTNDPRFAPIIARRIIISREPDRRRTQATVLQVIAVTAPIGIIAGYGISHYTGRSKLTGGIIGGVAGVSVPFVYPWLFALFYWMSGARGF